MEPGSHFSHYIDKQALVEITATDVAYNMTDVLIFLFIIIQ